MKHFFLIAAITILSCSVSSGQGTIRGKVTDENGESAIGAAIVLKSNRSIGVTTDLDGNYSLHLSDSSAQVLQVSLVSYKTVEEIVHPLHGEVIIKNFVLVPAANEMKEVTVTAKVVRAKEYYMEEIKKKSATTIDFVSSETMKKSGDVNVVAAVARVSGVSTNGGFITVRGIGDRYVKTSINGSVIPTLDPFTNNIKLDLFPANLVDNVLITKTASPDLPGDWAGAYLSVETKDYPDQLSVNAETSVGYNAQTTFKEVLSSQRSSTDWLGYDNGYRDRNHSEFVSAKINPGQYEELVALGLGDYYKSMGVTGWSEGTSAGDTYFKLGLVQMGLLAPALINDPVAVSAAKNQYVNGPYKAQAFTIINADVPKTGKSFADNWNTTSRTAPLNFSQSFSIGNQIKLLGKTFGFLAGFRYGSNIQYDPNSTSSRAGVAGGTNGGLVNTVTSEVSQQVSKETNGWSALINLAYKLNPNHGISFLFMPNLTGVNSVRDASDDKDRSGFLITKSQFYEQRKQLVYQFKSEHYIPVLKLKAELNASYTNGKSSAPDFKNISYVYDPISNAYQIGPTVGEGIHRYYRYLSDNLFDSRLAMEFPLSNKPGITRKLKFGGAYQKIDKKSDQYDYFINAGPYSTVSLQNGDLDQYFALNNFEIHSYTDNNGHAYNTIDSYYSQDQSPVNHTFGRSTIAAGFVMLDYTLIPSVRFSGGVRVETADIFTDVFLFDSLGYAANDGRRDYGNGLPAANPGKLNETTYLPSANVIYKLKSDDAAPVNLRLNYSQTVARPSIRELSDIAVYDYEFRKAVFGNSELKTVRVDNYDLRLESYFKSGDNVSASLFYKKFRNHIELGETTYGYTWKNVDDAHVAGIELEGKKKLSGHFEISANVTLVKSETVDKTKLSMEGSLRTYIPADAITHPMFGQAPYVINGIVTYSADSIGFTATVSYNVQGQRLVIISDNKEVPDIYELERHLLDVKISKKLAKHFSASLTVRDILNAPIIRAYHYTDGTKLDYDRYTFGTNYVFGIAYKL